MNNYEELDTRLINMFSEYPDILDVAQVSKMLKTDKKHVYRLMKSGELRHIRLERSIRTAKLWVIEYIQERSRAIEREINEERREAILEFCKTPRSRREMQEYLDLSDKKHFREKVLHPLLKEQLLVPTIPETPNHVKQRYVSTRTDLRDI